MLKQFQLITISESESMAAAHEKMTANKIRHLPVVDDQGKVIGILSDRDVQRAMTSIISIDDKGADIYGEVNGFDPNSMVRHYMNWPVKSVEGGADLRKVAGQMVADKISSILVTDEGRPIGIVTTEDVLKAFMGVLESSSVRFRLSAQDLIGNLGRA